MTEADVTGFAKLPPIENFLSHKAEAWANDDYVISRKKRVYEVLFGFQFFFFSFLFFLSFPSLFLSVALTKAVASSRDLSCVLYLTVSSFQYQYQWVVGQKQT